MMNGGDLYELAKILGHSNIKMIERYAKLGGEHITKTNTTAKVIWSLMKKKPGAGRRRPTRPTRRRLGDGSVLVVRRKPELFGCR
jgi:hypothetical protein